MARSRNLYVFSDTDPNLGSFWRHKGSGMSYKVIHLGYWEPTAEPSVIYESQHSGDVWVRPLQDFKNRFEFESY